MSFIRQELEWLLAYQLKLAARHRYFVSVVMVASDRRDINIKGLLQDSLRECDEFFDLQGRNAILMAHTGKDEAYEAVQRYLAQCNGEVDLRYSIVSYPSDGGAVGDIVAKGEQRLTLARRLGYGAVVAGDGFPISTVQSITRTSHEPEYQT